MLMLLRNNNLNKTLAEMSVVKYLAKNNQKNAQREGRFLLLKPRKFIFGYLYSRFYLLLSCSIGNSHINICNHHVTVHMNNPAICKCAWPFVQ